MLTKRTGSVRSRRFKGRRISISKLAREIGPRLHTAFRLSRVALWRFKRSPAQQDRAAMVATFAFIGLFAVGSVDAIVTGRADFAPGSAYASEYQPERMTTLAAATAPPVEVAVAEEVVKSAADTGIDYSVTAEILLGGPAELALADLPPAEAVAEDDKLQTEAVAEAQSTKTAS